MSKTLNGSKLVLRPLWQIVLAVVAAISIPFSVFILSQRIDWRSGATPTETPAEIVISNISDTSATIAFETRSIKTKSLLNYGETENSLNNSSFDERRKYDANAPETYKLHYHKLVNLKPNKEYFFSLTIGDQNYTNSSYKFKTLSTSSIQVPAPLNGTIEGGSFEEGIMYIYLKSNDKRSSVISELIPQSGNFAVSLSSAVDQSGNTFLTDNPNPEVYIFANGADKGKGAIKTTKDATSISIKLNTQNVKEYDPETIETELNISGASPTPTLIASVSPTPATIDETSKKLTFEMVDIESKELITPKNIAIGNPSTTSFTVVWTTLKPLKGAVAYGINKTPDALTYDKRDTASSQKERYTHIVDIIDSKFKAGDIVNLIIVSDEKEFINQNDYFKYKVPSVPNAPSPTSIEGKLTTSSTNKAQKDFIVLAKTSNSSWIITTVNESSNFSLSTGSLVDKELSNSLTLKDNDTLNIVVFGELNSQESKSVNYETDLLVVIPVEPGLTIDNVENEDQIPPGGKINGTAKPSSNISVKLGDSAADSIKADSSGKWTYIIPENAQRGNQNLTITEGDNSISIEITIQIDELPITNPTPTATPGVSITVTPIPSATPTGKLADTALDQKNLNYFYGFLIFIIGIYLLRLADRKKY